MNTYDYTTLDFDDFQLYNEVIDQQIDFQLSEHECFDSEEYSYNF